MRGCRKTEGNKMRNHRWLWKLLSISLFGWCMAGCADDSGVLPPLSKEGSGGAPIRCTTPGLTVDGLLQDGSWPMVWGTIVSVEPVLDRSEEHTSELQSRVH